MPKIINPIAYAVMTYGKPHAHAIPQPQQVAIDIVGADLAELEQRVAAMYHDEIKDAQDENP